MKNQVIVLLGFLLLTTPEVKSQVDWANFQWPILGYTASPADITFYAKCYEPGVTNLTGSSPLIKVWIGYNTSNTNPVTWNNWILAVYNMQYDDADEYMARIGASLEPGIYWVSLIRGYMCSL